MQCPKCKSSYVQKRGKRAGKQRYSCTNCGACFTENTEYKVSIKPIKIVGIECPHCHSTNLFKDGHLKDRAQRYECKDCGLNFSDKTTIDKRVPWKCPYCGGDMFYSGYGKKGDRSYQCKECKRSCTADKEGKPIKREFFHEINKTVKCPVCGSYNLKKGGFSVLNKQRYICTICGKHFTEDTRSPEIKKRALRLILSGTSVSKAAKETGYSVCHLRRIVKPYYAKEKITKSQEKDIIKYGYFLKVPVDYMAEYVKCSEHKCLEVLESYKNKIKSTNPDTML